MKLGAKCWLTCTLCILYSLRFAGNLLAKCLSFEYKVSRMTLHIPVVLLVKTIITFVKFSSDMVHMYCTCKLVLVLWIWLRVTYQWQNRDDNQILLINFQLLAIFKYLFLMAEFRIYFWINVVSSVLSADLGKIYLSFSSKWNFEVRARSCCGWRLQSIWE